MFLRIRSFRSKIFFKSFFSSSEKTAFPESVPYKFSGLEYNDDNNLGKRFSEQFIDENVRNLKKGFVFAYDGLLNAIQTEDLEFLNTVLESKFFSEQEEYTKILEKNNLRIELIEKDADVIVLPQQISFFLGVNLQRDSNPKKIHKNHVKNPLIPIYYYFPGFSKSSLLEFGNMKSLKMIFQIPIVFQSKKKLILLKKDEVLKENQQNSDYEYHKVLFECEGLDLASKPGILFDLIKLIRKINKNTFQLFLDKVLFQEDFEWKVTDIDDYMNGNEFTE